MSEEKIKSFEQAKKELDGILNEFDGDQVTLDDLVPRLKRAKELIDFCTKKIKQVETEAKEIVKSIEPRGAQRGEASAKDEDVPF
ncbi:MAG: exodeoxyribonuclease VII small subunit [Candidatus Omnitrophica bacterium]|nr:exodeoxyribonuclease VII small subunit [Candidatus Omnitrophota bacterium]